MHETTTRNSSRGSRRSPLEGVVGCARDDYKEFKSRQQTLSTGGRGWLCTRLLQGIQVETADALHWRAWSAVHETTTRNSSRDSRRSPLEGVVGCARDDYKEFKSRQQMLSTGGRGRLCSRLLHVQGIRADKRLS